MNPRHCNHLILDSTTSTGVGRGALVEVVEGVSVGDGVGRDCCGVE